MKHLSVLIKPASSLCNIRCQYCFYADVSSLREVKSYGLMSIDTMQAVINTIYLDLNDGDHMTFAFQGGEPTLVGLPFFKSFVEFVKQKNCKVIVHYSIQTNGMHLTDEWVQFFKEYHFLVGLSIDLLPKLHDANRLDVKGKGTYQRVLKAKELLDQYQIEYNVLSVLTNELAKHPKEVYQLIKSLSIQYVQFTPCMDDLNATKASEYALKPASFASFYQTLLPMWYEDLMQNKVMSIALFVFEPLKTTKRGTISKLHLLHKLSNLTILLL